MNFNQSKDIILKIFDANDFIENAKKRRYHTTLIPAWRCSNGTEISLSFPGKKSEQKPWGYNYDYRVDTKINNIVVSLSHANIVVDIYNKITRGGMIPEDLRDVLIYSMEEEDFDLDAITAALKYTPIAPKGGLLDTVRKVHGGKPFDMRGNARDLTIEEFFVSMKWIAMQEDINYPISQGKQGRKMPLARYLEAIHVCTDDEHTLEEVVYRTLVHSIPEPWAGVDYSHEPRIK
jgi:hypothetical protein